MPMRYLSRKMRHLFSSITVNSKAIKGPGLSLDNDHSLSMNAMLPSSSPLTPEVIEITPWSVLAVLTEFAEGFESLQKRVAYLQARLNQDSTNSNRQPSTYNALKKSTPQTRAGEPESVSAEASVSSACAPLKSSSCFLAHARVVAGK